MNARRPPYSRPSVDDILSTPARLDAVSTFSGGGASCLGLRLAGFRVLWASEFVPAARETYLANQPDSYVSAQDIREVSAESILADLSDLGHDIERGEIDLLEGSPPCSAFSVIGKREKGWGEERKYSDTRQRTDDLFDEYVRLVYGLQPRAFVAENVEGLIRGESAGYLRQVLTNLRACGYRVAARVLFAQWYRVPQHRSRIILVGVREDQGLLPVFPRPELHPNDFYTLEEALADVDTNDPEHVDDVERSTDFRGYAIGDEWTQLDPGENSEVFFSLLRPRLDLPCPTITQTAGQKAAASTTHPSEPRKLTRAELRSVFGYPPDFQLPGDYQQGVERLGRSVPPQFYRAVAGAIANALTAGPEEDA